MRGYSDPLIQSTRRLKAVDLPYIFGKIISLSIRGGADYFFVFFVSI